MRKIAIAGLIAALIGLWSASVVATHCATAPAPADCSVTPILVPSVTPPAPTCTVTTTYFPDGRKLVCTTCCSGALCTTNCI